MRNISQSEIEDSTKITGPSPQKYQFHEIKIHKQFQVGETQKMINAVNNPQFSFIIEDIIGTIGEN